MEIVPIGMLMGSGRRVPSVSDIRSEGAGSAGPFVAWLRGARGGK